MIQSAAEMLEPGGHERPSDVAWTFVWLALKNTGVVLALMVIAAVGLALMPAPHF